jgi:hypothetical protein
MVRHKLFDSNKNQFKNSFTYHFRAKSDDFRGSKIPRDSVDL